MKLPGDHGDVKMTLTVVKVLPWLEAEGRMEVEGCMEAWRFGSSWGNYRCGMVTSLKSQH